ncbi:MAG: HAMP domain-containing histidine kinase [Deltaproteobacteria bacterium]|jgi:signal transduction histidine kinase|nr:HAMP domain-containing histidine kinase [Deltaproteobacteria bacterium]MBT6492476.1 HAMP domain-containing histidine kinase [Deltaproteobacteria bacterium]
MMTESKPNRIQQTLRILKVVVDRFLPPAIQDGDEEALRRARTIVVFSWLFVPMVPIAWTVYSWLGWEHLIGPVVWWGVITCLVPFLMRLTGSLNVAAFVSLLHFSTTVLMVSCFTGGWNSPVLWWVVPLPFIAGSVAGSRGAIGWTLIAAGIVMVQWWLTPNGWVVELPTTASDMRINNIATLCAMLCVVLMAFLYTEYLRFDALNRLKQVNVAMRAARDQAQNSLKRVAGSKRRADAALSFAEKSAAESAESNRVKSEILRMTAHDLRGPLSEMTGLARLALDDDGEPGITKEEALELILKSSDHMRELLESLLDLNKLETGQMVPKAVALDTGMIHQNVLEEFYGRARAKHIQLECIAPERPHELWTDLIMLRQILQNLISNAIKYSSRGSVVYFEIHTGFDEVEFVVRDEGQGMTPEDMTNLYKPFARLSARPTANESSVGVGLSIVKGLVDVLGGQILCQSQLGAGTTFRVILPIGSPEGSSTSTGEFALLA